LVKGLNNTAPGCAVNARYKCGLPSHFANSCPNDLIERAITRHLL
jgi:hypothetical protein